MTLPEDLNQISLELIEKATELGLNKHGFFDPQVLPLREDVLAMCEQNICGQYGKNWTCPPGNGRLEDWREKIKEYRAGMIFQRVCQLEDSFDWEGMMDGEKVIKEAFTELKRLNPTEDEKLLFLAVGGCTLCEVCLYPDAPCIMPDLAMPSVESLGILVSELCTLAGIPYYNGQDTITYTGAVLMK